MQFTLEERETIINLNEADDVAYIYTRMKRWWEELEKRGFKPVRVYGNGRGVYAKEFEISKKLVKIPRPRRTASKAQLVALAQARRKSPILGRETPVAAEKSDKEKRGMANPINRIN